MSKTTANVICLVFIAIAAGMSAYMYPALPDPMPAHWNIEGEVDRYMVKPWGVIVLPLATVFVFVLMKIIPAISPRGFRTDKFADVVNIVMVALTGFMSGITILVLLEASGRDVHLNEAVFSAVGLLFIVLGNYLGKVRKNFFIGIRTPWTLASDEVWNRTHRMGGWVFVLIGFFMFLNAFVALPEGLLIWSIVLLALVPVVYSYFLYRKLEGFVPDDPEDPVDSELG